MHLCFKKVIENFFNVFRHLEWHSVLQVNLFTCVFFRSLAWHNVLQVNLFFTLVKNVDYGN